MTCEIEGCKHAAYRASGFCLIHLTESYKAKGEEKCRNHACSNMAEFFGLCHHCNDIYEQGKAVMKNRIGSKGKI